MKRSCSFILDDGHHATVVMLALVLAPFMTKIAEEHINIYSSLDMKSGYNVALLVASSPVLLAFLEVDPRGGLFSQSLMSKALKKAFDDAQLMKQQLLANTLTLKQAYEEVLETIAYKL